MRLSKPSKNRFGYFLHIDDNEERVCIWDRVKNIMIATFPIIDKTICKTIVAKMNYRNKIRIKQKDNKGDKYGIYA